LKKQEKLLGFTVLTFLLLKYKMASPTPSDSSKDALPSIPGCDTIIDLAYVLIYQDSPRFFEKCNSLFD
jgi:hypothetical protein